MGFELLVDKEATIKGISRKKGYAENIQDQNLEIGVKYMKNFIDQNIIEWWEHPEFWINEWKMNILDSYRKFESKKRAMCLQKYGNTVEM